MDNKNWTRFTNLLHFDKLIDIALWLYGCAKKNSLLALHVVKVFQPVCCVGSELS